MNKTFSERGLDKDGFPNEEGVYSHIEYCDGKKSEKEIDVYDHPVKGLCCYVHDYGDGAPLLDGDSEINPHIAVQATSLEFITKLRDFEK